MKKLIALVVVLVGIALLPLVGNKVVKQTIENRLTALNSYGLSSKLFKEEKGYLSTKLSYKMTVSDEKKFLQYLQQFSSKQFPPYTQSLLEGVEFGLDLAYSNIPLSEKISIDLYPIRFSDVTMEDLKKESPEIYAIVREVLKKRALLYHVDYSVVNGEFDGYMKDFSEHVKTQDGGELSMSFSGIKSTGKGILLAPDMLKTSIDRFSVDLHSSDGMFALKLSDLVSTASFESETTYISSLKLHDAVFIVEDTTNKTKLDARLVNLVFDASSNTQGKDASVFAKVHLDSLRVLGDTAEYKVEDFNYDIAISGIAKESYIKIQRILEYASNGTLTSVQEQELQKELLNIFANGLELTIADFSLKKLSTQLAKDIDGFRIDLGMKVVKDDDFVQKYRQNPNALANNIKLRSYMEFSKQFYAMINQIYPVEIMTGPYKVEKNEHVVFDIEFKNAKLFINTKRFTKSE